MNRMDCKAIERNARRAWLAAGALWLAAAGTLQAQTTGSAGAGPTGNPAVSTTTAGRSAGGEAVRGLYPDYSRWSVGVNFGVPFQRGDFHSFSHDKTYAGLAGGIQVGYQISRVFGVSLTGDFGRADGGAKGNELDFILQPDGNSFYGPWENRPSGAVHYNDLWNRVRFRNFGLHADIVLNQFFRNSLVEPRRWTVLLSPAVYLQRFDPTVYNRSDDGRFTTADLDNPVNLGLGGDAAVRYRVGRHVDLQVKAGIVWIDNNSFDGIATCCTKKYNWLATASVGIVWKIGNRSKQENLMYAPRRTARVVPPVAAEPAPVPAPRPAPVPPAPEKKEEPRPAAVVVSDRLPELPAIYFRRDEATIDRVKYGSELAVIVRALQDAPDVRVVILGYADHTGGVPVNDRITKARAEALKAYLVAQGIDASRLTTKGMGKDASFSGAEAYSERARRVVVKEE